ncbi:YoaK family protein [Roseomonas elaeocarpi]|uniref:YoaK family protein n=1 Tax=Roseomonas elaeocarpi TaxID=907779 RepID=A0ABV6K013_9PROT
MKLSIPLVLTFNGGFVDTAGFLALQGLFPAHVTGNFVTIGAALTGGSAGVVTKLLALPTFGLVVLLTTLLGRSLTERRRPAAQLLLTLKLVLLVLGAGMAVTLLPGQAVDSPAAMLTGLVLVTAMAVQNGFHRLHLGAFPPSTLMTGTTTQVMIDLADLLRGLPTERTRETRGRLRLMLPQLAVFALGCAVAAALYAATGAWCFVLAPLVALLALLASLSEGATT